MKSFASGMFCGVVQAEAFSCGLHSIPEEQAMTETVEMPETLVRRVKLSEGEIRFYREQGFLVIPGVLSTETVAGLHTEIMAIMRTLGGSEGSKLKQSAEFLEGSALEKFVLTKSLEDIAGQLMGGPSSLYLPFTAVKGSGGKQFHFHQDNNYTRFEDGMLGINLWHALTDMTLENGCLMVVPRSHLAGQAESVNAGDGDNHRKVAVEPSAFLPLRMRAGDMVAFSRLTIHGSGGNQTTEPRVAYAVQFHRNDAYFRDSASGEQKLLLTDSPHRQYTRGVSEITVPKGKVDGH
jgi:2-oxoglutarate-dependent dioxygenase